MEYLTASFDEIVADAKKNDRVDELKAYGLKSVNATKIVDGEEVKYKRNRTYLEIKRWYFKTYYPEQVPTAKPKPETIYDKLENL